VYQIVTVNDAVKVSKMPKKKKHIIVTANKD